MDSKKKDVVAAYTSKPLGKERPLTPPLSTSDVEGSRIIGELCSAICPHEMVQNKVAVRLGSYHTVRSCTQHMWSAVAHAAGVHAWLIPRHLAASPSPVDLGALHPNSLTDTHVAAAFAVPSASYCSSNGETTCSIV